MVTYSKADSAMGHLCISKMHVPYHYKLFTSKEQHKMVVRSLCRLQESGFYYGSINGKQANALLENEPTGTFLVRDSADIHYFYTISVKTALGVRNLRIQVDNNSFYMSTDPMKSDCVPHFDCILKLIKHYMPLGIGAKVTFIYSKGETAPLELIKPLYHTTSSLQHLCRKQINRDMSAPSERDQLPVSVQQYLFDYNESF
ncbi:suppressor of cytokine signaling 3a [Kryptolebias marmoratus]|uniref:suppressor of cytokine signaling 3a n=1 Tax=Kryptolebias marmoratus TaxID=37003 RepID=UPI0007F92741|nr:suppressor of cytokine signaling 3a [Kryptolebias marmoratus]